jgi:hypothetical protein
MISALDTILPLLEYEIDYEYPDGDNIYLCMDSSIMPVIRVTSCPLKDSIGVAEYKDGKLHVVTGYPPLHKCNNHIVHQGAGYYYILIDGRMVYASKKS